MPDPLNVTNRPLAASGFQSYRCKGAFGWIMIGATDDDDAMVQARRSSAHAKREDLQKWVNGGYVPVEGCRLRLNDGIPDHGKVIIDGYYSNGYPWQAGYDSQISGCSVAQDGRDILAVGERYTAEGMRLRDAIRHAEILGDIVPNEAYLRLGSLTLENQSEVQPQRDAPRG